VPQRVERGAGCGGLLHPRDVRARLARAHHSVKAPHTGTVAELREPSDALLTFESRAAALVGALLAAPAAAFGYAPGALSGRVTLALCAPGLPEPQRGKRTFVRVITQDVGEKGGMVLSQVALAGWFARYLEENGRS
jgi:hypothetical protein